MTDKSWNNSLCSFVADIIEYEIKKEDTDKDKCIKYLHWIKQNCQTTAYSKGETPPHLEDYQIEKGDLKGEDGVVVYKGEEMPKSAAELKKKYEKD